MPAATLDYFVGECSSPQTDAAKHNFPDDGKCLKMMTLSFQVIFVLRIFTNYEKMRKIS